CGDCGRRFAKRFNLSQHHHTHTGLKPCTCTNCGKSFSRKSNLIRHIRLHTGEQPAARHTKRQGARRFQGKRQPPGGPFPA
ncbi:ZNF71 factor, partial [Semnornis frantzii]|nr:ZNF71 factor [Semnornis frantzii]